MDELFLIVGLGNPGPEYAGTRHNAGFALLQTLAERWGASWHEARRFRARVARVRRPGRCLLLCQPQTFMNASGEAVGPLVRFYRLPLERLLVVLDDADLPLGEIRLRPRGSSGGHHGLESIQTALGTSDFARLRIGIGRAPGAREITNYVLSRFSPEEAALVKKVLARAAEQVECWLTDGIHKAMSRYNGPVEPEPDRRPGHQQQTL
ncbi:MAG: aminoacyl-tRNA hydrolase [Verrucomicrobiae bacterium]|nr:aminoacyl-tRNA hydrolase [Verrucomicrobiae bacterium]